MLIGVAPDALLSSIAEESERIASIVDGGDLDAPVAVCAPWDLRALVAHLGGVQRWAAGHVAGLGHTSHAAPHGREELAAWFRDGAGHLVAVLAEAGTDRPCWSLAEPATSGFWLRRQAHETALHRVDAETSQQATSPDPRGHAYPAALAEDAVDEVVAVLAPRQVRRGSLEAPDAVVRIATDGGTIVDLPSDDPSAPPVAVVRGDARALALVLWKRVALEETGIRIEGDERAARRALALPLTP